MDDLGQLSDQELDARIGQAAAPPKPGEVGKLSDAELDAAITGYHARHEQALAPHYQKAVEEERAAQATPEWSVARAVNPGYAHSYNLRHWTGTAVVPEVQAARAQGRLESGTADDEDLATIARHRLRRQIDAQIEAGQTPTQQFGQKLMTVPGQLAQLLAGGKVAQALTPARLASAPGVAGALGRTAAEANLNPAFVPTLAVHANLEAGRDPFDLQGLAAGEALGVVQLGVLKATGVLGTKLGAKLSPDAGELSKVLGAGASGPVTQQLTDFATHASGLSTRYGALQDYMEGKYGDAAAKVITDAVTFATFRAMHGDPDGGRALLERVRGTIDDRARRGDPARDAVKAVAETVEAARPETPPEQPAQPEPAPETPQATPAAAEPPAGPDKRVPATLSDDELRAFRHVRPGESPELYAERLLAGPQPINAADLREAGVRQDKASAILEGLVRSGKARREGSFYVPATPEVPDPDRRTDYDFRPDESGVEDGTLTGRFGGNEISIIPSPYAPGKAYVVSLSGRNVAGSGRKIAEAIRRLGFSDIEYTPETEDDRGAARSRLFESLRRQFAAGPEAAPKAEVTPQGPPEQAAGPPPAEPGERMVETPAGTVPESVARKMGYGPKEPQAPPPENETPRQKADRLAREVEAAERAKEDADERARTGLRGARQEWRRAHELLEGSEGTPGLRRQLSEAYDRAHEAADPNQVAAVGAALREAFPEVAVGDLGSLARGVSGRDANVVYDRVHGTVNVDFFHEGRVGVERPAKELAAGSLDFARRLKLLAATLRGSGVELTYSAAGRRAEAYSRALESLGYLRDQGTRATEYRWRYAHEPPPESPPPAKPGEGETGQVPKPEDFAPAEQRRIDTHVRVQLGRGLSPEAVESAEREIKAKVLAERGPKLAELWDRYQQTGDAGSLKDIFDAADLTDRERRVIQGRLEGKPLADLGRAMGFTRERARQVEADARAKLGVKGSLEEVSVKPGAADRAADMVADGKLTEAGDLGFTPEEARPVLKGKADAAEEARGKLEELATQMMKEMDDAGDAGLAPEREAYFQSEGARLDSVARGYARPEGQEPPRVPGQTAPGESRPAPEAPPDRAPAADQGVPAAPGAGVGPRKPVNDPIRDLANELAATEVHPGAFQSPLMTKVAEGIQNQLAKMASSLRYGYRELAGQMGPRTTDISRESGEALARFNAAPVYAKFAARDLIDKVIGPNASESDRRAAGAVVTERRLRYIRDSYLREGDAEAAAAVKTIVGQEGSPLKTEEDYRRAMASDYMKGVFAKFKEHVAPLMDQFYRKAQGLAQDDPIDSLTQIPGEPVNLKAIRGGEDVPASAVFTNGGRGNLKNPRQRPSPFARQATGAADVYDIDLGSIIENSMRGASVAAKAELYDTLKAHNVAAQDKPGQTVTLDGEAARELPGVFTGKRAEGGTSLYVKEGAYDEVRKALAVDAPVKFPTVKAVSDLLTKSALASTVEGAYHTKNNLTFLMRPGVRPADLVRNAYRVMTGDPETVSRLVDLARIGAMKDHGMEPGPLGKLNPLQWTGKFLDALQRVMRLTADDAFGRLQRSGLAVASETNRRDFINQLGQYNKSAQNDAVRLLRDTGVGPFATAGTNYTVQGIRGLLMEPGVQATGPRAALQLRAAMLGKTAAVLSAVALANYFLHKRVDGDDQTPLGGIKVGDDGNGRTAYFDLTGLIGLNRGARMIGLTSLLEGARQGKTQGQIGDKAVESVVESLMHPAMGPMVQFAHTAYTGEDSLGHKIAPQVSTARTAAGAARARAAGKPEPGSSQHWENFVAALKNANPLYGTVTGSDRPTSEVPADEKIMKLLGPFGVKYRYAPKPAGTRRK